MSYEYGVSGLGVIPLVQKLRDSFSSQRESACGGIACREGFERHVVRVDPNDPLSLSSQESEMRQRGCSIQCSENEAFYYCCPVEEKDSGMTVMYVSPDGLRRAASYSMSLNLPTTPPPPIQDLGTRSTFPWAWVSVLGIIGVGAAGFAGYWFWWRHRGEQQETDQ